MNALKMIGNDYGGTYEYYPIKDYKICNICKYFVDNKFELRFECWKDTQEEGLECFEMRFGRVK